VKDGLNFTVMKGVKMDYEDEARKTIEQINEQLKDVDEKLAVKLLQAKSDLLGSLLELEIDRTGLIART